MSEPSVLLATESSAARENFRVSLTKLGMKMTAVMSWRQASEFVQKEKYSFVICDSKLADCTGLEFLANLKSTPSQSAHKLLMTEELSANLTAQAKEVGVTAFVLKPVVLARLESLFRCLLEYPVPQSSLEVFPGASASTHKVAMAFLKDPKDFDSLRVALKGFDVFLIAALNIRTGIQNWASLKPDMTFIDNNLNEGRGLEIVKALKTTDRTAEFTVLARQVDTNLVKELSQLSVKNCLLWPLNKEAAFASFSKCFVRKPEVQCEPPPKLKEMPLEFPSIKALLVDCHAEGASRTTHFLSEMKFDVTSAADSKAALAIWKQGKTELIVSNFELGQDASDNGLNLLKNIRKEDVRIPFIMTSQADCWQQVEEAQKLGCAGWLQKPYERDEIQRVVKKAMASQLKNGQWVKETK